MIRAAVATALGLGISAGVLCLILIQRWVAECDEQQITARPR